MRIVFHSIDLFTVLCCFNWIELIELEWDGMEWIDSVIKWLS